MGSQSVSSQQSAVIRLYREIPLQSSFPVGRRDQHRVSVCIREEEYEDLYFVSPDQPPPRSGIRRGGDQDKPLLSQRRIIDRGWLHKVPGRLSTIYCALDVGRGNEVEFKSGPKFQCS